MSSEILLRPEEIEGQAARIKNYAENTQEIFAEQRRDLNTLSESFRGQAKEKFDDRFEVWERGADGVLESLESLATWLEQAAARFAEVDQQIGSSLDA